MKSEDSKILQLPPEQIEWLLSVKNLYKTDFYSSAINIKELISNIKNKAIEKGYAEIGLLDYTYLEEFFKR